MHSCSVRIEAGLAALGEVNGHATHESLGILHQICGEVVEGHGAIHRHHCEVRQPKGLENDLKGEVEQMTSVSLIGPEGSQAINLLHPSDLHMASTCTIHPKRWKSFSFFRAFQKNFQSTFRPGQEVTLLPILSTEFEPLRCKTCSTGGTNSSFRLYTFWDRARRQCVLLFRLLDQMARSFIRLSTNSLVKAPVCLLTRVIAVADCTALAASLNPLRLNRFSTSSTLRRCH